MTITEDELKELIKPPNADIEKITSISDDGRNLLTRIPKEIVEFLKIKKGNNFRWLIKAKTKELSIEIINGK